MTGPHGGLSTDSVERTLLTEREIPKDDGSSGLARARRLMQTLRSHSRDQQSAKEIEVLLNLERIFLSIPTDEKGPVRPLRWEGSALRLQAESAKCAPASCNTGIDVGRRRSL